MMVNVFSLVLCGEAVCDNGHVHLMNVLHKMAVERFPTEALTLDLFMLASRDNGPKNTIDVKISPPDVTIGPSVVGRVEVTSPPGEISVLSCRIGCKYGAAGTYFFDVFCGNELIGQTKLILLEGGGEYKHDGWKPDPNANDWSPPDDPKL
jgi:hypothetical protein